ncbi:hypothetical protein LIER_28127 [Lithospermum erythrorhizon]|uniref:Wound-responsive family protein n=1 Tax=Lithospermum erythrorhizon TaxID=34254 RepID=A0AAV3REJ0_LITER
MNASRKAWIVAASIGAVEALKDQGIARWNYPLRALQQSLKSKIFASYQSQRIPLSQSIVSSQTKIQNMRKTDISVKKAMELSCWGPSTVRF